MDENSSEMGSWQRPSSRIKLKVKKRRTSENGFKAKSSFNVLKQSNGQQDGGVSRKRSNPFGCSSLAKKAVLQTKSENTENRLFKLLNGETEGDIYPSKEACSVAQTQSLSLVDENTENSTETSSEEGRESFPLDWSLKTKVRFTSSMSFSWATSLKSVDFAESTTNFVRCQDEITSLSTLLYKESKVWMHPSLPWLQLFPRNNSIKQLGNGLNDAEFASSLQREWVTSFHSVFNLLRCGHCPYFYLCTNQCSMLFITTGIYTDVTAIITPTTKGFREALTKEGIEFTLPHGKAEESNTSAGSDSDDEQDDDNDAWLQSVGLQKDQLPTSDKRNNAAIRNKDQHPSSTIIIQGCHTLALSNFILNWKSITSKSGGVPPTVISPVAFEGATLRSHKINQGSVKHQQHNGMQKLFSLEVSGAILPGCLQSICKLVQTKHNGDFTATLTPYQATVAFNTVSHGRNDSMPATLDKCGLTEGQVEYFAQTEQDLEKTCIKELKCKNGLYIWKS